jgi:hypothetical protein
MRLRRAVPKIPPKSSLPTGLPLHRGRALRTPSKSTLPQLLIPLHFNFRTCNVYKKPGEGMPVSRPKVLQLVTPHWSSQVCPTGSSTGFTLLLFSYSYALLCKAPSVECFVINHFRTPHEKHPGWGLHPSSQLPLGSRCCSWSSLVTSRKSLSSAQSALPPNEPVTPVESALPKHGT